jgi:23S rRNA pseudouridine2605 synthase
MRLNKRISNSGFCSRRDADLLIKDGRVAVNGVVILNLATRATQEDIIQIDGKRLPEIPLARIWLYYKPAGIVTSHKDEQNRQTVFDNLPQNLPKVISVGRLDMNSEGLLLLTNSGDLARMYELPSNNFQRVYHVRVYGKISQTQQNMLQKSIIIDGVKYAPINVTFMRGQSSNNWYEICLHEGKNREIRKIFAYFGMQVNKLIRVAYGPYRLGDLKHGDVCEIEVIK